MIRATLLLSMLVASGLGMQAVHELGHVLGAWATGGRVANVALHPLGISRTDLQTNPRPLIVAWMGPVFGALGPLTAWVAMAKFRAPGAYLWRFFAGFCLIANGLYLGVGSFNRVGDCGDLLRYGARPWQLWLFGAASVPAGLLLWHGQGRHFGWGRDAQPIVARDALCPLAVAAILLAWGFWAGA